MNDFEDCLCLFGGIPLSFAPFQGLAAILSCQEFTFQLSGVTGTGRVRLVSLVGRSSIDGSDKVGSDWALAYFVNRGFEPGTSKVRRHHSAQRERREYQINEWKPNQALLIFYSLLRDRWRTVKVTQSFLLFVPNWLPRFILTNCICFMPECLNEMKGKNICLADMWGNLCFKSHDRTLAPGRTLS